MATKSQFRRAIRRWRLCFYFSKLKTNCVSDSQVDACTELVKVVYPKFKSSNVARSIRSYGCYLNNMSFYMSLSLFQTYVSLEQHIVSFSTCSSTCILKYITDIIDAMRTLNDDKHSENERRKEYILDNIGLTNTQTQIVRMIIHDTTILSENTAVWTCIERSVEFMMQMIHLERQRGAFDTFFRFMYKIRCALLAKCASNAKRQQHVTAILSFDRIQIMIGSEVMMDDAMALILSAATYVISDISTMQTCIESPKAERHTMFIVECYYKFDIALF
jgi:hypothetical protein